jgi:hypothetical protein
VEKGAVTLEGIGGEQIPLEKVDVVIMNPPFTRQERLPKEYKDALMRRLKGYENYLHGQLGLYGYFILLADKFTKENGRIALVLPATLLRLNSTIGIRKLLVKNYHIEAIITTLQRAAFSEGARFREILLIAKKLGETEKVLTSNFWSILTILKKIPKSLEEATKVAETIKTFRDNPKTMGEYYEDSSLTMLRIPQKELEKKIDNMFSFIATIDLKLARYWNQIIDRANTKLTPLNNHLKEINAKIIRGIEMEANLPVSAYDTFILYNLERAIKSKDLWVVKEVANNAIIAENRFTHLIVSIPFKSLTFGLRRLTGINKIDITDELDYVVVDDFADSSIFFTKPSALKELKKWKEYTTTRMTKLVISRRFNLAAPGTNLLAYFSDKDFVPTKIFWSIKNIEEEDRKVIALWLNSTLNILQVLIERMETEGGFINFDKYVVTKSLVINPKKLNSDKKLLLETFDKVKDVRFPSILRQLKEKFWARVEMDRAILKVLGFNEQETNQILDYLYPALTKEIEQLKTLMQG